jgi:uncharacterized protein (TIGR01777 family)
MKKKIVIAGGTGFIGKYLAKEFEKMGYDVLVISRRDGDVQWTHPQEMVSALEKANIVINLAGKSVDCRYNAKNKVEILGSRTETTRMLGAAIEKCKNPPSLWINSSTGTIYRHAEDRPMTEDQGEIGKGFSVDVATSWEKAFFSFHLKQTRQVALRMAIVLGKDGGVIKPFLNLVRFGLGGKQGNGKQMFSWIHIADVFNIILFIFEHKELNAVYNCSAPNPVTNEILMKTLRERTNTKFGLPTPSWLLKKGAAIIKTETELILKSRWVVPEKLLKAGYPFRYPTLAGAIENILGNRVPE